MQIVLRVLLVGFLMLAAYIGGLARERLCFSTSGVEVAVNGKTVEEAKAYVCPNDRILIRIPGQLPLLVDRQKSTILYAATEFHNFLGVVFAHEPDPTGVSLTDRIKVEEDPHLEFTENGFSYNGMDSNDRIEIKFTN